MTLTTPNERCIRENKEYIFVFEEENLQKKKRRKICNLKNKERKKMGLKRPNNLH